MSYIHFVGVMSPSMASLAMYARLKGERVSGSDDRHDASLGRVLGDAGVTLFDMFAQANINQPDLVVMARFFDDRHPEWLAAKAQGVEVVSETDYLARLAGDATLTAVLGVYEGPLVAAWLHHIYRVAGQPLGGLSYVVTPKQPLASVGDDQRFLVPFSGLKRDWHVYESDFLQFQPSRVVITSIVYDYPDLATTLDEVYESYFAFVKRLPRTGLIVGNSDWSRMKRMRVHLADRKIETYGFERDADWTILSVNQTGETTTFSLKRGRDVIGPFEIPFRGSVFVAAAAAVIVTCFLDDVKLDVLGKGLTSLPAVERYFSVDSDSLGRVYIDDCADNPATIEDVLIEVRQRYPGRKLWCLYQSGSFLRLKALQADYELVLSAADVVYFADIHGLPKEKSEGVHARHVVSHLRQTKSQTFYIEDPHEVAMLLDERMATSDCLVTLGAVGACQDIRLELLARHPN